MGTELSKASASIPEVISEDPIERHRRLALAGALIVAALLGLVLVFLLSPRSAGSPAATAPPSIAAPTPVPEPTDSLRNLCDKANQLTQGGNPAEALALIEKIRGQVRSPALAATTACEAQRLAAVLKSQEPPKAKTPTYAQDVGANWDRFTTDWINPLVKAGPALLGLIAAFLVLGRLLVFVPKISGARKSPADRATLALAGLVLILLGSSVIVSSPAWDENGVLTGGAAGQMVTGGLLALFGSVVFAVYLSSRLRVSLDVRDTKGETSKVDVSRIGALLHELGGDAPRGLEIPEGADVTALGTDTLPLTFTNKVLAAVQKVLISIFGVVPWRVVVSSADDNSLTVAMARNGASVGAATIARNELHLAIGTSGGAGRDITSAAAAKSDSAAELELHKMAAAYILVMLARKHYGFSGLCGTTDWRSLGLHYVATTDNAMDDERAKKLLGAAIDYDAGNMLAEVALQHRMFRESTDAPTVQTYAEWLLRQSRIIRSGIDNGEKSAAGYTPLRYRIEKTFLSMVLNLPPDAAEFDGLRSEARQMAKKMIADLDPARRPLVAGTLAQTMRLDAALAHHDLLVSAGSTVPELDDLCKQALVSVAPHTAYNAACSLARNKAPESEVTRRLGYAFADSANKDWARKDPELAELRKKEDFLHFLGVQPRGDFWKLEPFEPYEKRLREAGVATPGDLYQKEVGQSAVSAYLKVSPLVLKRLCRLAALVRHAEAVPGHGDAWHIYPLRVEVVSALVQAGIESPKDIQDPWIADMASDMAGSGDPGPFVAGLRNTIRRRILRAPDAGQLKEWLRQLKDTHDI
ncbi:hypothetical protein [Arthrobacter sp. NPDC056727]|uniref:hypothetical protein n=1 Tax=Arthrobacter sp. NPDC056727 TaxID=3345927 RepID=UPI00367196E8